MRSHARITSLVVLSSACTTAVSIHINLDDCDATPSPYTEEPKVSGNDFIKNKMSKGKFKKIRKKK